MALFTVQVSMYLERHMDFHYIYIWRPYSSFINPWELFGYSIDTASDHDDHAWVYSVYSIHLKK